MRSLLFVPGDSDRKLVKALGAAADALILDLEDSVSPANKEAARRGVAAFLKAETTTAQSNRPQLYVRINDLTSGLADDDLSAIMAAQPDGILLPKAIGAASISRLSAKLRVCEAENGLADGATAIVALITETAASMLQAARFDAPLSRLRGLTWGAEDLSASIGARSTRDEAGRYTDVFRLARATTLLAAAAAETAAIDTVFIDFRDLKGLETESRAAERDGFTGKLAIHPDQVEIINSAFTPSPDAVRQAEMLVAAFHQAGNAGVVGIDGKMYDRPHLARAERLLARAAAMPG